MYNLLHYTEVYRCAPYRRPTSLVSLALHLFDLRADFRSPLHLDITIATIATKLKRT